MSITIIAIAGGSGSGKTTLAKKICSLIGFSSCTIISQDNYYHDQSHRFDADGGSVNFDHPDALDFQLLAQHLKELKLGRPVEIPLYDFVTHKRLSSTEITHPTNFIVIDGTLIFSQPCIVDEADYKLFVDVPEEIRLQRRIKRDISERGRTREGVLKQFYAQVKPMHDLFVEPSKKYADHLAGDDFDVQRFCNIIFQQD